MIYLELFWAYIQIGLFSIGGGHASIPVAQSMVVDGLGWMTMDEFTAMITISEMTGTKKLTIKKKKPCYR